MAERSENIRLLELQQELHRREAERSFPVYLDYIQPKYRRQWFHTLIARKCQELIEGTLGTNRLMIFVPPQHGKTEIVSRKLPSWALGKKPQYKIVGASYSADLAYQFSRSIQRTIDSRKYRELFPNTYISGSRSAAAAAAGGQLQERGYRRNIDFFETVGQGGFYKAVGVLGGLTGTPIDIGIIDDPVKDALEANSPTYRDRIWEWYVNVFAPRLHNESKQCLIQTRWHEDDLAGRLIEQEGDKWEIITIPAIREDYDLAEDPREIGEALWEEVHSLERLKEQEERSPRTFAALYQQRPSVEGGNIVKRDWFGDITPSDFAALHRNEPVVFFLDTAYTEDTKNDYSGIIATCKVGNTLYITHGKKVRMEFPELLRFIPSYVREHGYTFKSTIRIEPKANGLSVIQQLKAVTGLNVTRTPSPTESKETRLSAASPSVESGRVVLVCGAWTEDFLTEVCGFPAKPHDEYVDVLCYAIDYHLNSTFKPIDKARTASIIY